MIITVTLNAAIDKSLSVPSFRLGRRHRTVERRALAGGKGVERRADAEDARAAGDRDRLRRAGRPGARSSPSSPRSRSSTTSCASARSRGRTPRCSIRRPASRPRSTSRARRSTPTSSSSSARSSSTWRAAPRSWCSPARCRAASSPSFYAQLVRELRKLDVMTVVDTDGEPLRLAVRAEPDVVSPNVVEAEELVGHEFNDDARPRRRRARDRLARRALGDHDDAATAAGRRSSSTARRASTASTVPRVESVATSAPATPSSPATSRRATAAPRRPSACASASPAAPSRPAGWAPG